MRKPATTRAALSTLAALLAAGALAAPASAAADGEARTLKLGGRECRLIEVPTEAPLAGTGACPGVRPGALVESRVGFCTMNFLFRDGDGRRYIGTAGHCVLRRNGERRFGRRGPVARDRRGRQIGRFAYAVLGGERDFALIRLNRGVRAFPRMCHFGGPTGIDGSNPRGLVSLSHYGQGIGWGGSTPARTFLATGMPSDRYVFAYGTVTPGDSGGPVTRRRSDRAAGLVVTVGFHAGRGQAGTVGITRVGPQRARAARVLHERLRLVTARAR